MLDQRQYGVDCICDGCVDSALSSLVNLVLSGKVRAIGPSDLQFSLVLHLHLLQVYVYSENSVQGLVRFQMVVFMSFYSV